MEEVKGEKIQRVLELYTKFMNGDLVNKTAEANNYKVNERTIQRDIDDIRGFLEVDAGKYDRMNTIVYDRQKRGYRLEQIYKSKLTNGEVLAICKILLDSRAFTKSEMTGMLEKLISGCVPESEKQSVRSLIMNEEYHYIEPRHRTQFIDMMWMIGQAIQHNRYLEIEYFRMMDKTVVHRRVKPAAIMFSEYYFYLTAFIDDEKLKHQFEQPDDVFPTIYRIDRIKKLEIPGDTFRVPYSSRFQEGEFRKRVQFMYGGRLQRVKFRFSGNDIDSVFDRLPTARILSEGDGSCLFEAEVFGKGIEMWIRSQGGLITDVSYS